MQSLLIVKKSFGLSFSYPDISSYVSRFLCTFVGSDSNNLCLANQDYVTLLSSSLSFAGISWPFQPDF